MLLVAATAGLGGGNFASSMANISFFYPDRMKGWGLGLNAAGGNIGVSSVQLLTPILMGVGLINLYQGTPTAAASTPERGLMWLLPLAIAVFGAIFFMNNLTSARSTLKDQVAIVGRKHTWIMSDHLHRDFRLVHRLLGRLSAADKNPIPGGHGRASPSSVRSWGLSHVRSADCSPTRSAAP